MILFAVILGVIQGLQYFTQAYVAAGVASGQASQAADVTSVSLGYPLDSTLVYPVLLYQHGFTDFQMGYASAMAMLLLAVSFARHARDPHQLAQVGPLRRCGAMTRGRRRPRRARAVALPAAVRRKRFLVAVANHAVLIGARDRVPRAVRLHHAHGADVEQAGALAATSGRTRSAGATSSTSSRRRRSGGGRSTRSSTRCSRRSGVVVSSVPVAYALARLRWRGRRGRCSWSCSSR